MHIEYTGRNTVFTPKLKLQAQTELARIAPVAGNVVGAHVILTEDKYRQIAEITVKTGTGTLIAACEGTDIAGALHAALQRIEQQAVRHRQRKTKLTRHPKPLNALAPAPAAA